MNEIKTNWIGDMTFEAEADGRGFPAEKNAFRDR